MIHAGAIVAAMISRVRSLNRIKWITRKNYKVGSNLHHISRQRFLEPFSLTLRASFWARRKCAINKLIIRRSQKDAFMHAQ